MVIQHDKLNHQHTSIFINIDTYIYHIWNISCTYRYISEDSIDRGMAWLWISHTCLYFACRWSGGNILARSCISTRPKLRNHPQSPPRPPEAFQDSRPSAEPDMVRWYHGRLNNELNNFNTAHPSAPASPCVILVFPPRKEKKHTNTHTHIRNKTETLSLSD